MTNTQIKELEVKIAEVINSSNVNIATTALILDKLAKEANAILVQVIAEEQKKEAEEQEQARKAEEAAKAEKIEVLASDDMNA